jgi:hypothetical protein
MTLSTKPTRRSIIAAFPAMTAALSPEVAADIGELSTDCTADPIFAAIQAHKRAAKAYSEAIDRDGDSSDEANDHEEEAFWTVFDTTPTTAAGLVALVEYLFSPRFVNDGASMLRWAFETWPGVAHDPEEDYRDDEEHIGEIAWLAMIAQALRDVKAEART